jgi:hypothetical protein
MKKSVLFVTSLLFACSMTSVHPKSGYTIFKENGIDIAQATAIACLANGILASKARLERPLSNVMNNEVFRFLTWLNLVRAVYTAL